MTERPVPADVSVLIPVLNRARWLPEALDSVLAEPDCELVCVDDGSDDGSRDILHDYAEREPDRVRVFLRDDGERGIGSATNLALREARGSWIAFQDSDDVWLPGRLTRQCDAAADAPEVGFFYGPKERIGPDGELLGGRTRPCPSGRVTEHLFREVFVPTPSVLVRRDVLEAVGGFDESLRASDYLTWLRLSLHTPFLAVSGEGGPDAPLVRTRRHGDNISSTAGIAGLEETLGVLERFAEEAGDALDPAVVRRRLSMLQCKIGRRLVRSGRRERGLEHLRAAVARGGATLRALPAWLLGHVMPAGKSA